MGPSTSWVAAGSCGPDPWAPLYPVSCPVRLLSPLWKASVADRDLPSLSTTMIDPSSHHGHSHGHKEKPRETQAGYPAY